MYLWLYRPAKQAILVCSIKYVPFNISRNRFIFKGYNYPRTERCWPDTMTCQTSRNIIVNWFYSRDELPVILFNTACLQRSDNIEKAELVAKACYFSSTNLSARYSRVFSQSWITCRLDTWRRATLKFRVVRNDSRKEEKISSSKMAVYPAHGLHSRRPFLCFVDHWILLKTV